MRSRISPEAAEQELLDTVQFGDEPEMARVASELMHTSCMYNILDYDASLDRTPMHN